MSFSKKRRMLNKLINIISFNNGKNWMNMFSNLYVRLMKKSIKTQFSKEDVEKILNNYELGKLVELKLLKKGTVNINILLKTTEGKFVLRCYKYRTKKYILFEVDVLNHFYGRKYPCEAPIRNIHGRFIGNFQGKYYAMFKYVEGAHVNKPNKKQKIELAKYLADLHNISEGYRPRYSKFRDTLDEKYCLTIAKKEYKRFNSKRIAQKRLDYLKEQLNSLKFPDSIPQGVAHCDYYTDNIKFQGNKIKMILDFDTACYTCLIYDVASLILCCAWAKEKKLNFTTAKFLLNNYNKHRKLSQIEKEHIYDALKLILLTYMSWFFYNKFKGFDFFEDSKKKIEELEKIGRKEFYKKLFN